MYVIPALHSLTIQYFVCFSSRGDTSPFHPERGVMLHESFSPVHIPVRTHSPTHVHALPTHSCTPFPAHPITTYCMHPFSRSPYYHLLHAPIFPLTLLPLTACTPFPAHPIATYCMHPFSRSPYCLPYCMHPLFPLTLLAYCHLLHAPLFTSTT